MCACIDEHRFLLFSQPTQPRQDHVPENFNAAARELEVMWCWSWWWDYLAWDDWIRIYFHVAHVPHLEIYHLHPCPAQRAMCGTRIRFLWPLLGLWATGWGFRENWFVVIESHLSCGSCAIVDLVHSMHSLIHAMAVWSVKAPRWDQLSALNTLRLTTSHQFQGATQALR